MMVEKQIPQLELAEVRLIANQIDLAVIQEIIPGNPAGLTTGAFFKNIHLHSTALILHNGRVPAG
jgi:hypothetical protein